MYIIEIIGHYGTCAAFPVEGHEAAWTLWRETTNLLESYTRVILVWNDTGEILADSADEGKEE